MNFYCPHSAVLTAGGGAPNLRDTSQNMVGVVEITVEDGVEVAVVEGIPGENLGGPGGEAGAGDPI